MSNNGKINTSISDLKTGLNDFGKNIDNIGKKIDNTMSSMVEYYELETIKNAPKMDKNIFDWEKNSATDQFGGDQGALETNYIDFVNDPKIKEIINKYYPDEEVTEEDLQLLFSRMNYTGCGYIAFCNTVFEHAFETMSEVEFIKTFGFYPYTIKTNKDGTEYTDYNYEYTYLDFYLYFQKVNKFKSIKEIYGNEKNNPGDDDDFELVGANGTYGWDVASIGKDYLKEKGINLKTYCQDYDTEIDQNSDNYEERKNKLEKYGFEIDDGGYIYSNGLKSFKNALNDGKKIIVSCGTKAPFDIHTKEINDDGKIEYYVYEDIDGHAMSVVDVDEDNDMLIVSTWGEIALIDFEAVENFQIYDYD